MTTTVTTHRARPTAQPTTLRARRLPRYAAPLIALAALLVAGGIVYGTGIGGPVLVVAVAALLYLAGLFAAANAVEGRRAARNRTWSALIHSAFVLAVLPLASVVWTLVSKGAGGLVIHSDTGPYEPVQISWAERRQNRAAAGLGSSGASRMPLLGR